jgi:hypothetical protein
MRALLSCGRSEAVQFELSVCGRLRSDEGTESPAAAANAMPILAAQSIGLYHDNDRPRYLDTLFRLQLVAGLYSDAAKTLAELVRQAVIARNTCCAGGLRRYR